jgi:hypothetical protein
MCTFVCSLSKSNVGERKIGVDGRDEEEGVIYGIILMDSFAGSGILG